MPKIGQRTSDAKADADRLRNTLQEVLTAAGLIGTDRPLPIPDLIAIAKVFTETERGAGLAPPNPLIDDDIPF